MSSFATLRVSWLRSFSSFVISMRNFVYAESILRQPEIDQVRLSRMPRIRGHEPRRRILFIQNTH